MRGDGAIMNDRSAAAAVVANQTRNVTRILSLTPQFTLLAIARKNFHASSTSIKRMRVDDGNFGKQLYSNNSRI
jgi:hypothetical protein